MVVEKRKEFKEFEEYKGEEPGARIQDPGGPRGGALPRWRGRGEQRPANLGISSSPSVLTFASLRKIYLVLANCLGAPDRAANRPRV
jgi:hypothetical protein